jgi:hypothetical protein
LANQHQSRGYEREKRKEKKEKVVEALVTAFSIDMHNLIRKSTLHRFECNH